MPFSLTDLKRSYGRRSANGDLPEVRPYLLAGRELAAQLPRLEAALAWQHAQCGRRRRDIDLDELAHVTGDYRLARCFAACLQSAYRYEREDFEAAVIDAPGSVSQDRRRWSRLQELGIHSASALRLHVYDGVNHDHGGFVVPDQRLAALAAQAEQLQMEAAHLEALLWLDAEEHERLRQVAPAPSALALAGAYNRRALETILIRTLSADLLLPDPDGPAIRRFYFLLKCQGLLCDLSLAEPAPKGATVHRPVRAHVFGPLEIFGPRTRHGERFAQVVLALLRTFPGLQGSAHVLLNEREFQLRLEPALAQTIAPEHAVAERADGVDHTNEDAGADDRTPTYVARRDEEATFDSQVEAQLFATLRGMERLDDCSGWHVEREPEPIIHDGVVSVPDFAFSRREHAGESGDRATRVYVEVIGFWTSAYRERKRAKLRQLAGQIRLALVVQEHLLADFQDLPFPVLPYKQRVLAGELIRLLDREFDRPAGRLELARGRLAAVLEAAEPSHVLIPAAALKQRLGLAGTDSLAAVLPASMTPVALETAPVGLGGPEHAAGELLSGWTRVPGVGLCRSRWIDHIKAVCARALARSSQPSQPGIESDASGGEEGVALEALREVVATARLPSAHLAVAHLEALLPVAGFEVRWHSLFEAVVLRA